MLILHPLNDGSVQVRHGFPKRRMPRFWPAYGGPVHATTVIRARSHASQAAGRSPSRLIGAGRRSRRDVPAETLELLETCDAVPEPDAPSIMEGIAVAVADPYPGPVSRSNARIIARPPSIRRRSASVTLPTGRTKREATTARTARHTARLG